MNTNKKFRNLFFIYLGLALLAVSIMSFILFCFPITKSASINKADIHPVSGYAYSVDLVFRIPVFFSTQGTVDYDWIDDNSRSNLILLEDDKVFGKPHSIHSDIQSSGGGKYSHWGYKLYFSSSDNSDPRNGSHKYTIKYMINPPSWLPLISLLLSIWIIKNINIKSLTRQYAENSIFVLILLEMNKKCQKIVAQKYTLFWILCLAIAIYLNVSFSYLLPSPLVGADSGLYIGGALFRTVGYPLFINLYSNMFHSWNLFSIIQLNLLLLGLFSMAAVLIDFTKKIIYSWILICSILSSGNLILFSGDIMTEAIFSGLLMLHLSFFYFYLKYRHALSAVISGLSLAIVILIKSIGIIFIFPIFIFVIISTQYKLFAKLFLFTIPFAAWIGPGIYNYYNNNFFGTSTIGGYSLIGQTAWIIPKMKNEEKSTEAKIIEKSIVTVLSKRPDKFESIEKYISYTSDEYNALLWNSIVPAITKYEGCTSGAGSYCTWKKCEEICHIHMTKTLSKVALEAVLSRPDLYFWHTISHFYGTWSVVFLNPTNLLAGINERSMLADDERYNKIFKESMFYLPIKNPVLLTRDERGVVFNKLNYNPFKRFIDIVTLGKVFALTNYMYKHVAPIIIFVSISTCLLLFCWRRLNYRMSWLCYINLVINLYFFAVSMAQPTLLRYAVPMQAIVATSILLIIHVLICNIKRNGFKKTLDGFCKYIRSFNYYYNLASTSKCDLGQFVEVTENR